MTQPGTDVLRAQACDVGEGFGGNIQLPDALQRDASAQYQIGILRAHAGSGEQVLRGALRVCIWSALAMAFTALVGHWFGVAVAG